MPEPRFWAIIEKSLASENDPENQLAIIRSELRQLSSKEIETYEATFDAVMRKSYSWDLWGAAYVVHGGASDDGFEYFRCWLVSKGQRVFESVLAEPDNLADILAPDLDGVLEFEGFAYVAREVWGEKARQSPGDMPNAANMIYPGLNPTGNPFPEDPVSLAARYPKLWKRFGHSPLG